MHYREVICMRCGRRDLQRLTPDNTWHPGVCRKCGDGLSLYEVNLSHVGGFKPGQFCGNGEKYEGPPAISGDSFRGM